MEVLLKYFDQDNIHMRFVVLRALNKLRANFPVLKFDENYIETQILKDIENYFRTLSILCSLKEEKIIGFSDQGTAQDFSGLEKGWYNIYTDVDDDGLYDETDYINVMEGEIEISINDFPDPPPPPSV